MKKMKSSLPLLIVALLTSSTGFLAAQNSQRDSRGQQYEEAQFYDRTSQPVQRRGPFASLFRDIGKEVEYQREHFWDGMRGLKKDVRRAFRNDTPTQRIEREREQYRAMEAANANRFGYRPPAATPSNPNRSNNPAAGAPRELRPATGSELQPATGSDFAPAPAPREETRTTPSVSPKPPASPPSTASGETVTIVRPNPPVGASVTEPSDKKNPGATTPESPPAEKKRESVPPTSASSDPAPEKEKKPAVTRNSTSSKKKGLEKVDEAARQYPAATSTSRKGIVLSPFPPHEELDVSGMKSGELAIDPGNGRIFRIP